MLTSNGSYKLNSLLNKKGLVSEMAETSPVFVSFGGPAVLEFPLDPRLCVPPFQEFAISVGW